MEHLRSVGVLGMERAVLRFNARSSDVLVDAPLQVSSRQPRSSSHVDATRPTANDQGTDCSRTKHYGHHGHRDM